MSTDFEMAKSITVTANVIYTPPSAAVNSGQSAFSIPGTYNGQSVGSLEIPTTATLPVTYDVPFSNVVAAKTVMISNGAAAPVKIHVNGSVTATFEIPAGGLFMISSGAAPTVTPITALGVEPTAVPTTLENVSFWVFGD